MSKNFDSPIEIAFCGATPTERALTFEDFQKLNLDRQALGFPSSVEWTMGDWALALSGEVGELCNYLKKVRRGDSVYSLDPKSPFAKATRRFLLAELADIITYADLMMSKLDADTGEELIRKFDEVSARVAYQRGGQAPAVKS